MRISTTILGMLATLGLTACGSVDTVTRNVPLGAAPLAAEAQRPDPTQWSVVDVRVNVPRTLKVSEANVFYPLADIVWREDSFGDRYEQVRTILDDAVTRGVAGLNGPRKVFVDIDVSRFHSLTEKTRYTVGGVHSVRFVATVRDAATGEVLQEPQFVNADIKGFGGKAAFEAERRGETQKVRISGHVAGMIQQLYAPVADPVPALLQVAAAR